MIRPRAVFGGLASVLGLMGTTAFLALLDLTSIALDRLSGDEPM